MLTTLRALCKQYDSAYWQKVDEARGYPEEFVKALTDAGLTVVNVSDLTGFPEMMDGRVKTLQPAIHGGILARRTDGGHAKAMIDHKIAAIDLVVVNLYPFEATVARGADFPTCVENIDIGGPALIRASAKNHDFVTVVVDPADYKSVLDEMAANKGGTSLKLRRGLAAKAYARTASYDSAIANWFAKQQGETFPERLTMAAERVQVLRYGENPHQQAAFYRDLHPAPGTLAVAKQLQGKELSYNNIADADAAWECVKSFDTPACVIVKHANPCGVAVAPGPLQAYQKAFQTDPTSAFGGIIAFNRPLDQATAEAVSKQFVEVLIAPGYSPEALAVFTAKANVRVLHIDLPPDVAASRNRQDIKRVGSGLLIQSADNHMLKTTDLKVVTKRQPTPEQLSDLMFAWQVAQFVKSNAIVFCGNGMTLGVGAGQMSRLDSARIASIKAEHAGLSLKGTAVASDAFFPFRDGLDVVVDAGASCVAQPGGSMRDQEVIDAANERDVAMVFTGVRHFRH